MCHMLWNNTPETVAYNREILGLTPELATFKKVKLHPNCHAEFERSYYSAPFRFIGKLL